MHGSIPEGNAALVLLKQHFSVVLASQLLWLFRSEGKLTHKKAWGKLRGVRPATDNIAAP
jgi:hypothetical protein